MGRPSAYWRRNLEGKIDSAVASDMRLIEDWLTEGNMLTIEANKPVPLSKTPIGRKILSRNDFDAICFIRAYLCWMLAGNYWDNTLPMADPLFKRALPFSDDDLHFMAESSACINSLYQWPLGQIVTAVERRVARDGLSARLETLLKAMLKAVQVRASRKSDRAMIPRLEVLLHQNQCP